MLSPCAGLCGTGAQTINNPLGGVGGPAGPSTSIQKPVTCAAVFALFGTKSFLTGLPGREPQATREVLQTLDKVGDHFVDTLKPLCRLVRHRGSFAHRICIAMLTVC